MNKIYLITFSALFLFNISCDAQNRYLRKEERKEKKIVKHLKQEYLPITDNLFMGKYEVSYKEYFTFLNELKNSGNTELYEICKIDSMAADSFVTNGRYGKFYIKEHTLIQNCPVSKIGRAHV